MKVVNSRGRILLEVTSAHRDTIDSVTTYTYKGSGVGGNVDLVGLTETLAYLRLDNPSAKVVGMLPQPTIDHTPNWQQDGLTPPNHWAAGPL